MRRFSLLFAMVLLTEFSLLGGLIHFLAGNDRKLWLVCILFCLAMGSVGPAWSTGRWAVKWVERLIGGKHSSRPSKTLMD